MITSKYRIEYLIRIILICFSITTQLLFTKNLNYGYYVLFMLFFILSTQIRTTFLKDKLFLLSLLVEIGIILYMNMKFVSITYILLFIPCIDAILKFREEDLIIIISFMGILGYMIKDKSTDVLLLNLAVFLVITVICIQIRNLKEKVNEVEILYDDNRKYSYQLEEAQKRLEEYSKIIRHTSQLEERNRISGELHDTIGHKLTGVFMQLEAGSRLMDVDPVKGMEIIGEVKDNMSRCIDLLRETVKDMKPKEYGSRILSIAQMLKEFSNTSGVIIDFDVRGNPFRLNTSAEITLYRNVQEAVTNAVRHGKAQKIEVLLEYRNDRVILLVSDNGEGCSSIIKGIGLRGMEERVELLGGSLELDYGNEYFKVRTIIPVKQEM